MSAQTPSYEAKSQNANKANGTNKAKTLYLIDVMSMAFRHYHALARGGFFTSLGFPTSALFGVTRALFSLYHREKPAYLVAASDAKKATFRQAIYPGYKAQRSEMPEELAEQMPKVFELFHLLGVPVLTKPGWEADDIIATIAKQTARFQDSQNQTDLVSPLVRIVTGDKDMMQLVDDSTYLYQTKKTGEVVLVGRSEVEEYFGVPPEKVTVAQALIGDPTDAIPGVAGIGKATAAKILADYSSLDEIYQSIDNISSKNLREKLICGKESAYCSEKLATLATDLDLDFRLADARVKPELWTEDNLSLSKFFQKCEFRTLRNRYLPGSKDLPALVPFAPRGTEEAADESEAKTASVPKQSLALSSEVLARYLSATKTYMLDPELDLGWLVDQVRQARQVMFHVFTSEDARHQARKAFSAGLHLLIMSHQSASTEDAGIRGQSIQVLWTQEHGLGENPKFQHALAQILFASEASIVTFDGKSAMHRLAASGMMIEEYSFCDLQIIEGLVLAKEAPRTQKQAFEARLGESFAALLDMPAEEPAYGAICSLGYSFLHAIFHSPEYRLKTMKYVLWHIEIPLSYVLFEMESTGVYVDRDHLESYTAWLSSEMARQAERIYELAGETFNIQSPKQLGQIIYGKLKLHEGAKRKISGSLSTRESALRKLPPHDLIEHVLYFRKLAKLKSTYASALVDLIDPSTGRIHTSFNQMGTVTGRMSSERPNLQNIPIRTDLGKEIRKAFCAPSMDKVMISADYSQIELRVLAHLSQDKQLIKAFHDGEDIHRATAARMLQKPLKEVTDEDRQMAKAINYGIVYGMGATRLAATIGCSYKKAASLIGEYFDQFSGVADYMKHVEEFASKHGHTLTYNGRMRMVPAGDAAKPGSQAARNSPIQGTAADLMKLAMIRVFRALKSSGIRCSMLLQIHDELLFECHKDCLEQAVALIEKEMVEAESFSVPLQVSIGSGANWLEAH